MPSNDASGVARTNERGGGDDDDDDGDDDIASAAATAAAAARKRSFPAERRALAAGHLHAAARPTEGRGGEEGDASEAEAEAEAAEVAAAAATTRPTTRATAELDSGPFSLPLPPLPPPPLPLKPPSRGLSILRALRAAPSFWDPGPSTTRQSLAGRTSCFFMLPF